jgi:hypothetical protein
VGPELLRPHPGGGDRGVDRADRAYVTFSREVFPGDGKVTDDTVRTFLTTYMAEFRDHIVRVLTVLPRQTPAAGSQ